MKLAAQGIQCSLSGVKPVSSVWPKEAIKFLKVAIESNLAEVQFVDKVDDFFNVKIFSLNDRKTSLNESMVEKGHAAPREDVAQPTSQKEVKKPIPQQSNNQQQDKVSHDQGLSNHQAAAAESVNIQNKTPSKQRHDEEDKKSNEALPKTPVTQQASMDPQVGSANQMVKLKNATIPDNESIPVCVTHVVHPNEFYVQQANEDTARALADLMTSINKHYLKASQTISQVQIGQLCCAKFSQDQAWYRAVVLDYAESKVKVQFVDFGNCEEVGLEDIQLLDKKFTSTPILAIRCTLSGVTGTLEGGQWEDKTVQAFTEEILNRQCVVKAVGKVDDGVSEIELYGSSSEESLNQLLITAKLAVKKMPQVKDHTDGVVKEMLQVKGHKEETVKDVPEVKGHTDGAVKISQVKDDNENVIAVSEIQRIKVESVKAAAIPTLQLPTNEECPVIVHDVVNPSEMYCQLATAENLLQVNALFEEMNSDPMSQQEDTVYKPDIGDLCSAQFTLDQSWCRAEVISIEDDVAVVKYVDFGNQEIVPLTAIKRLDEQFTLLPKQANKCAIAGIVPKDGSWSEDATAALKTLTGLGSKRLFGVVTGTCGDVTELELMDTATGEPVVISEKLVEDGYAAWKKAKAAKSDEVIPGGDNAASPGVNVASPGVVIHSDQTASPDASTPNDQVAGPGASASSDKAVSPGPSTPSDQAASPDVSTQGESSLIECLLKENVNMKTLMLEQQKQIQQMMQMLTELTTRKQ
ncbi:tudor domain-containing protein 1-like isoform X2 [Ptychodera flava]|uniref:tudor domain-containing protein 1-like isoform X2 n=1 Tax=Ptychodera flava TaxID=63121 RepID=UPI00396A5A56